MKKTIKPGVYRLPGKNRKGNEFESYRIVTLDGKKKKQWATFATLKDAIDWHASTEDISRGKTLRDVWGYFQQNKLKTLEVSTQNKLMSYAKHLEPAMDHPALKDWTPRTVDSLLQRWRDPEYLRDQKTTRTSYKNELALLKQLLSVYRDRFDFRFANPVIGDHLDLIRVRKATSKPKKDLSTREFGLFLAELKRATEGTDYESIAVMAHVQYGLYARIQEIAALHYEDFDPKTGLITLHRKMVWPRFKGQKAFVQTGLKASEEKRVRSSYVTKLLQEWCMRRGIRAGLVFAHEGGPIPYRAIQFRYDNAFIAVKLPHRGTHIVRHAALTEHYQTCGDIYETMQAAGHTNVKTTQVYAKHRDLKLDETQRAMDEKLEEVGLG